MRAIGIDVHGDFCEVAISEDGRLRSAGRITSRPAELEVFAASLARDDEVALEATGNALAIARIIKPHVARVVVASARELHAISDAKAKTDRRDARTLAKLLAAGMLEGTWLPDEQLRALRRRLAHRAQLVRARSRLKNEVHAALFRNLVGASSATDLFGVIGRRWLEDRVLPADERETLDSCLRTIAFLDGEIARFEVAIARYALRSVEIRRLLTIPGVGLLSAATFVAVVDDVHRFRSARKLVGYLGLDPRVRQSGCMAARTGTSPRRARRPPERRSARPPTRRCARPGRCVPSEGEWPPGAARQVAVVAVARKLATIAWRLLGNWPGLRLREPRSGASQVAAISSCLPVRPPARATDRELKRRPLGLLVCRAAWPLRGPFRMRAPLRRPRPCACLPVACQSATRRR